LWGGQTAPDSNLSIHRAAIIYQEKRHENFGFTQVVYDDTLDNIETAGKNAKEIISTVDETVSQWWE
jgi:hypothetical protein